MTAQDALEHAARLCEAAALQVREKVYWTCSKDCAAAIRAYAKTLPVSESRWIKCSERLPTNEESVLAYFAQTDTIHVLWMDPTEQMWFDPSDPDGPFSTHSSGYLTHWMPLPASPACNVGEQRPNKEKQR